MGARILDVSDFSLELLDGYWRYVCHRQQLVTSGFGTREAAERNANGYRDDAGTRAIMRKRYFDLFGE